MNLKTTIERGGRHYKVSTVFVGHGLNYETMVFASDERGTVTSFADLYCDRYDTEEDATAGHATAIKDFSPESNNA